MTVEWMPVGQRCNLKCGYCYENPLRDAGNEGSQQYDVDKMIEATEKSGADHFTLFGGEPLLVPLADLERIFRYGYERFKFNNIQSNGSLITDAHIALFRQYNVSVGISMDGPDELNDARHVGDILATRRTTQRSEDAIPRLLASRITPSLIATIHRLNGSGARLERLCNWFEHLDKIGIKHARLHPLEDDGPAWLKLTEGENIEAFRRLRRLERTLGTLRFDIFKEMEVMLREPLKNHGAGGPSCVWHGCDPHTTPAVQAVMGDGTLSNCGRTAKDGVPFTKPSVEGHERQLALYYTPYSAGGCAGCRFFLACRGECPGTGIGGDWRNRTAHCSMLMAIFEDIEQDMLSRGDTPYTSFTEREVVQYFTGIQQHLDTEHGDQEHGDQRHQDRFFLGIAPVGRPSEEDERDSS